MTPNQSTAYAHRLSEALTIIDLLGFGSSVDEDSIIEEAARRFLGLHAAGWCDHDLTAVFNGRCECGAEIDNPGVACICGPAGLCDYHAGIEIIQTNAEHAPVLATACLEDGQITISFGYMDDNANLQHLTLDVTSFAEILARDLLIAHVELTMADEE